MQNYFFYTIRLVDIGYEACIRRHLTSNFFVIQQQQQQSLLAFPFNIGIATLK